MRDGIDTFVNMIRDHESYDKRPLIVAVVGAGAVGKTTVVVPEILAKIPRAVAVAEDDYCIGNTASTALHDGVPHLLTPEDYQPNLQVQHIQQIKDGKPVTIPEYDYAFREPSGRSRVINPRQLVIFEGAYLLNQPIRDEVDLALFVSVDAHDRFVRTAIRPRRNPAQTDVARLQQYFERTYPSYAIHTAPTADFADVIIANPYEPREGLCRIMPASSPFNTPDAHLKYTHPSMADSELLALAVPLEGVQMLTYVPDTERPDKYVSFNIPEAEYTLDPTKIGYTCSEG